MAMENPFLNAKVATPEEKPKDLLDMLLQAVDTAMKVVGKPFGINAGSVGKTSFLANLNFEQGAFKADSKITGDKILGIAGDTKPAGAEFLIGALQLSTIKEIRSEAPNLGELATNNVTWSDLGGVTPGTASSGIVSGNDGPSFNS